MKIHVSSIAEMLYVDHPVLLGVWFIDGLSDIWVNFYSLQLEN